MALSGVFLKQWEVIYFVAFRLCSCLSSALILITKCVPCRFTAVLTVPFPSYLLQNSWPCSSSDFTGYSECFFHHIPFFYFPFFAMWIRFHSRWQCVFLPLFIHAGCRPISAEYLNHTSPLKSNVKVILWFRWWELLTVWVAFCCSI